MKIFYWAPFILAGAGISLVGVLTWPRRRVRGAKWLILLCLSAAWWSVCEGLLYFGWDAETNLFLTKIQYLGITVAPVATLLFTLSLFGMEEMIRPALVVPLAATSAAALALAWTNEHHHLIWRRYWTITTGDFPMLGLEHGVAFFFWLAEIYTILAVTTIILARQLIVAPTVHRRQALAFLISLAVVWAANGIYLAGLSPVPNVDQTPLAFAFLAAATAFSFYRYGLLDLLPVAKTEIFTNLTDGVVVLDGQDRIIDLNPAAERILGLDEAEATGRSIHQVLTGPPEVLASLDDIGQDYTEVCSVGAEDGRTYELRLSPLADRRGRPLGRLLVLRDITDRKRLENELVRLATFDSLTETLNRRSFLERGRREFALARRHGRPLAILMIDLDRFKAINDRFGHPLGDRALRALSGTCRQELRETDLFGRMGGDEFAVLLPEVGETAAWRAAERLRQATANIALSTGLGQIGLTISLGLAELTPADRDLTDLIHRADAALYRAKAAGKNRTEAG